jgi:leucyl aminopeptidase (aminopeptidase T)
MAEQPTLLTPTLLTRSAELVVDHCIGVGAGDLCLVISDKKRWPEGEAIAGVILARGAVPLLLDVSSEVARYYATQQRPEPPDHMAATFVASTFVFGVADVQYCHLLGHTEKNQAAQEGGMQYVLVEEDMSSWTTTPEDIDEFVERTFRVSELLGRGKWVHVSTQVGTDACFQLKPGRKVWNFAAKTSKRREAPIVPNYAESACVPWEGTMEGRAIIDGYIISVGADHRDDPVELIIKNGRAVEVNGGPAAARLREIMEAADENANNMAECGICTSHREKRSYEYEYGAPGHFSYGAWGTTHFAVGHSHTIGGDVHSKIHLDCQMFDTTVYVDDVCVMENGVYKY